MPVTFDNVFDELERLCGVCSHCRKRDCADSHTSPVLPNKLNRDDVLLALENAFAKKGTKK